MNYKRLLLKNLADLADSAREHYELHARAAEAGVITAEVQEQLKAVNKLHDEQVEERELIATNL